MAVSEARNWRDVHREYAEDGVRIFEFVYRAVGDITTRSISKRAFRVLLVQAYRDAGKPWHFWTPENLETAVHNFVVHYRWYCFWKMPGRWRVKDIRAALEHHQREDRMEHYDRWMERG